jgi:hypothetical protein
MRSSAGWLDMPNTCQPAYNFVNNFVRTFLLAVPARIADEIVDNVKAMGKRGCARQPWLSPCWA